MMGVNKDLVVPTNPLEADGYPGFDWLEETPEGWRPPDRALHPTWDDLRELDYRNRGVHFPPARGKKKGRRGRGRKRSVLSPEPEPLRVEEPQVVQATRVKLKAGEVLGWAPHQGPQTSFFTAKEFEVFYGGSAGGGKTDAQIMLPLKWRDSSNFRAVILRKTFPELQEIIDRSARVYRNFNAVWHESKKRWTFPSGAVIEMGYFELWKHHVRYQGQEYNVILWDELGTVPEERFWTFMMSRCRSADATLPKLMRATGNPGGSGHGWLKERFITPCGKNGQRVYTHPQTKLQRRFIPARLSDNPALVNADPGYQARLESLPPVLRAQLLDGDWGAASGLALHELNRSTHIIPGHELPSQWSFWGCVDWGYAHPASFGLFASDHDGHVRLVDAISMWRKLPHEIVERINECLLAAEEKWCSGFPIDLRLVVAGRDCWADYRGRGEVTPSVADQFSEMGMALTKANQSRIAGLNNIRAYLTVIGPGGMEVTPKFKMYDTPGNRLVFGTLQNMVLDPRDADDVLKVDADEYGMGGDDAYDMVRYALAQKPVVVMNKRKPVRDDRNYDTGFSKIMKAHESQRQGQRKRTFEDYLKSGRLW